MLNPFLRKYQTDIAETFKLSLPIIFGRLGAVLMGVTDSIMIGKVGYAHLAASGISNSVFIMVAIVAIGMMIVGSPMVSSANSRGNSEECVNITKSCIQVALLVSAFVFLLLYVFAFHFQWFNQTKEVEALAAPYLLVIAVSVFPQMFFIAVEQLTDGLEHTWVSMFFNTSGLLVNVAVNYLLIYGYFGLPALGLVGAGIGTLLARVYMAVGIWLVVHYNPRFKAYDLRRGLFKIHVDTFYKVMKQGIPSGLQFFFEVSAFSMAAIIVGWLGTVPLAAHNIAISLASTTYMLSSGFATGGSIRVGYAFGTLDKQGVWRAGISVLFTVVVFMALCCIVFVLFNRSLALLYNDEPAVVELASGLLVIAALFQFSDGVQVAALRALLGIEDVKIPTYITLLAYWVLGLPLGCVLTFVFGWGVFGIWTGLLVGLTIAAVLLTYRFFSKARRVGQPA